jgi:hypothetical protein
MPRKAEVAERLQRMGVLLKQLDKVSKQARDLHRMANELSREAASSMHAAKSIGLTRAVDAAPRSAARKPSKARRRTRRPTRD